MIIEVIEDNRGLIIAVHIGVEVRESVKAEGWRSSYLIIFVHIGIEFEDGVEAEDHGGHHEPDYCCSRWRRDWRRR
jgi:hypothetical protein